MGEGNRMRKYNQDAIKLNRLKVLWAIFFWIVVILVVRMLILQIFDQKTYEDRNSAQVQSSRILQSPRGTIYDRNGSPLAISVLTQSLYADPNMINRTPEELADLLAPYVTSKSKDDLVKDLSDKDTAFVWLERMMNREQAKALQDVLKNAGIKGIGFKEESKRTYPNGSLLAHVLGFVGSEDRGLDGIEFVLDDMIRGSQTQGKITTDNRGKAILDSVDAPYLPEKGSSVVLTIDSTVQFIAERTLDKLMEDTAPTRASVVIMDPKTGEILAMANRPTFDPNHYGESPVETFKNAAVTDLYEPGSTFKPLIASMALDAGKWDINRVYNDTGKVVVNGAVISNWDGEGHGPVRMLDIIKMSLNTGMVEIGLSAGPDVLSDYARAFGFGKRTGIELPGEGEGILFSKDDMAPIDTATMSFGQGIAVTPLQMVQAMSAMVNGGTMVKPHIIKEVDNSDGHAAVLTEREETGHPIKESTANTIRDMMEQEVSAGGGNNAMVEGYRFAGKTGTAQKLDTEHGGYIDGAYIASFIGFGPVDDARFIILITVDTPTKGSIYGSQIAAPAFRDIATQLVRYMQISPNVRDKTRTVSLEKEVLPDPVKDITGKVLVPDFRGHTMGEVRDWMLKAHMGFRPEGLGNAVDQEIAAGTKVDPGTDITVYFAR